MVDISRDLKAAQWAVARWEHFPVSRTPRPLVMIGPRQWSEGDFVSVDAKLAFFQGRIEAITSLPNAVLEFLRTSSHHHPSSHTAAVFVIKSAIRSQTSFATDRGPRLLPAWRLQSDDAHGYSWVLDPEIASTEWTPLQTTNPAPPFKDLPHRFISAIASPDERSLKVQFLGAAPTIEDYSRAEVVESSKAIAVVPIARHIGPHGPYRLAGHTRELRVELAMPLGARVLVDLDGTPAEVRLYK